MICARPEPCQWQCQSRVNHTAGANIQHWTPLGIELCNLLVVILSCWAMTLQIARRSTVGILPQHVPCTSNMDAQNNSASKPRRLSLHTPMHIHKGKHIHICAHPAPEIQSYPLWVRPCRIDRHAERFCDFLLISSIISSLPNNINLASSSTVSWKFMIV